MPNYNADGNEKLAPQQRQRSSQNGPEMGGTRANAQNLTSTATTSRPYAGDARVARPVQSLDPESSSTCTRATAAITASAHVFTVAQSRTFFGGVYARDTIYPVLRERMRTRHRFETFDYGNFSRNDTTGTWATYEHVPRFGSNYYGVRGRIGS